MDREPRIYPGTPPERLQTVVRGVCGALLGAVGALVAWIRHGGYGLAATIVLFAVAIAICTIGAIRHGDDFWISVLGRGRP